MAVETRGHDGPAGGRVRVASGAWSAASAELSVLERSGRCEADVLHEAVLLAQRALGGVHVRVEAADGAVLAEAPGPGGLLLRAPVPGGDGRPAAVLRAGRPPGAAAAGLAGFALELADTLDRVRLRRGADEPAAREHRRASRQRKLAEAALALTACREVEEVLRVVTETAQDVIGAHQAVTSRLTDGWADALTYVSLSDKYAEFRAYDQVPEGLGVLNAVTRENRPLRLTGEDLLAHPEFRGLRDAPGHPPLPDYLAAPLVARDGRNLGLVQLSDAVGTEPFTEDDEAVLVQLAQLASSVIEGLETLQRLQAERARAQALEEVGRAITSGRDLQETVQLATEAATGLTGAAFGAFFYNVEDERGEAYTLYTIAGAPLEDFSKFPMPRKTRVFAPTFDGDRILRSDDITQDERYGHNAPHQGLPTGHLPVRSYLAVPVVTKDGEVAGGLFFGHPDAGVFDEAAEQAAVSVAAQAAVALVNGRLMEAAQRELRRRRAALDVLQRSLLPPVLPAVRGFRIAARYRAGREQVGGDFYDLFALGGGRWGVVLGDVCGNGPEAAARTALTRHAVRTAAMFEDRPCAVLATLNESLLRDGDERFSTAVYATVRREGDGAVLVLASGGHPPALILRADGRVEEVRAPGRLLGVLEDVALEDREVRLGPGDLVVLHTDGLSEARQDGRLLGDAGVQHLLAGMAGLGAEGVAGGLVEAAEAFTDGALQDDLALVVLEVEPHP